MFSLWDTKNWHSLREEGSANTSQLPKNLYGAFLGRIPVWMEAGKIVREVNKDMGIGSLHNITHKM